MRSVHHSCIVLGRRLRTVTPPRPLARSATLHAKSKKTKAALAAAARTLGRSTPSRRDSHAVSAEAAGALPSGTIGAEDAVAGGVRGGRAERPRRRRHAAGRADGDGRAEERHARACDLVVSDVTAPTSGSSSRTARATSTTTTGTSSRRATAWSTWGDRRRCCRRGLPLPAPGGAKPVASYGDLEDSPNHLIPLLGGDLDLS